MKQSTRLRMRKEYLDHPLRKQYESEKSKVTVKNPIKYFFNLIAVLPFAMVIVYGVLFFGNIEIFGDLSFLIIPALGVGNIFACFFVPMWAIEQKDKLKKESDNFKRLKEKYAKEGLHEITEEELIDAECAELDLYDDWVCSATGQKLNSFDARWCLEKGNCKHCRKFVEAYLGNAEYWPYEIKR